MAAKRASMPFRDVVELIFSYRDLVRIDNLFGLDKLTKLKLDCNRVTCIENLSHLVRCPVSCTDPRQRCRSQSQCMQPRRGLTRTFLLSLSSGFRPSRCFRRQT